MDPALSAASTLAKMALLRSARCWIRLAVSPMIKFALSAILLKVCVMLYFDDYVYICAPICAFACANIEYTLHKARENAENILNWQPF
jgi:hypothetical protein